MTVLEFIFGTILIVLGSFTALIITVAVTDTRKIKEENKKLKEELQKARKSVLKREYKKSKEVK